MSIAMKSHGKASNTNWKEREKVSIGLIEYEPGNGRGFAREKKHHFVLLSSNLLSQSIIQISASFVAEW